MRQALLVIVLVGAAFGGGALVSGPGFRWAQDHLMDYMGLKDGGEIDTLDLTPPPEDAETASSAASGSEPLAGPAAAKAQGLPDASASSTPPPAPTPTATEPFAAAPAPASEKKPEPPALLGALASLTPSPKAADPKPAPTDPELAPTSLPTLEAPPTIPSPSPPSSSASSAPPSSSPGGDWTEIRRRLSEAGVSRYTIEGEPGGRVVFACLIPIAGKQAVSQRFEAEAADEIQAAQGVLKRINLWRASHAETPANP